MRNNRKLLLCIIAVVILSTLSVSCNIHPEGKGDNTLWDVNNWEDLTWSI